MAILPYCNVNGEYKVKRDEKERVSGVSHKISGPFAREGPADMVLRIILCLAGKLSTSHLLSDIAGNPGQHSESDSSLGQAACC